jgi:hypothetical protein
MNRQIGKTKKGLADLMIVSGRQDGRPEASLYLPKPVVSHSGQSSANQDRPIIDKQCMFINRVADRRFPERTCALRKYTG